PETPRTAPTRPLRPSGYSSPGSAPASDRAGASARNRAASDDSPVDSGSQRYGLLAAIQVYLASNNSRWLASATPPNVSRAETAPPRRLQSVPHRGLGRR